MDHLCVCGAFIPTLEWKENSGPLTVETSFKIQQNSPIKKIKIKKGEIYCRPQKLRSKKRSKKVAIDLEGFGLEFSKKTLGSSHVPPIYRECMSPDCKNMLKNYILSTCSNLHCVMNCSDTFRSMICCFLWMKFHTVKVTNIKQWNFFCKNLSEIFSL